jgi:hypothetical protein
MDRLDRLDALLSARRADRLRDDPSLDDGDVDRFEDDLSSAAPRRARLVHSAFWGYGVNVSELANVLETSRSALYREHQRILRDYVWPRPWCAWCGEPLPIGSTRRRKFCSDYCRVTFHRH